MATHDPTQRAAAELDKLSAAHVRAEERLEQARIPLQEAIVRHLRERSAPPGKLADHTPYDRNHVGRIAKAAEVPPLRGPDVGPPPVYDDTTARMAYAELDKLTAMFKRAEAKVEQTRDLLHEAIIRHYTARTLTPGVLADHTPYDRNHVGRIVKAAGAPSIRG
ncbi:hypothetical protein OHA04_27505 [Streptomyces sp. NBC_01590]|uniref:hypothetical protein n=1 Tax=Streptomyces sp. NBC_01590 TaxID=2975887 RepID=UPI00386C09B7